MQDVVYRYGSLVFGCKWYFLGMLGAHWVSGVLHFGGSTPNTPHFLDFGAGCVASLITFGGCKSDRSLITNASLTHVEIVENYDLFHHS